ncbi:Methyltransferase domain containing protein [Lotmaria passim]
MMAIVKEYAKSLQAWAYNVCIVPMTSRWYREVLLECPVGSSMLDVGIGAATSLIANRDVIVSKQMTVTGVDDDLAYVRSAQTNVAACGGSLQDVVTIEQADIHDYNKAHAVKFDVIYFSSNLMNTPRPVEALQHCVEMLRSPVPRIPDGCNIFFTQTFEKRTLVGLYVIPLVRRFLKAVTRIDIGEVTYEDDFRAVLKKAEVDVVRVKPMSSSHYRTQTLVMARPRVSLKRE